MGYLIGGILLLWFCIMIITYLDYDGTKDEKINRCLKVTGGILIMLGLLAGSIMTFWGFLKVVSGR